MEGNIRFTGTKNKFGTLPSIQEEGSDSNWGQNWDDFRNPTTQTPNLDSLDSQINATVIQRLENEDVEDKNSTVGYLKHVYNLVIDTEMISFFNDRYDIGDGVLTSTNNYQYIRKDDNIYRRKLFAPPKDELKKDKQDLKFSIRPAKLNNEQDLDQLGASSLPKKIQPPLDWTQSVYSDIMRGVKTKSEEPTKYIEASNLNKNPKKKSNHNNELKLWTINELNDIEQSIAELKKPTFDKLKEKYTSVKY